MFHPGTARRLNRLAERRWQSFPAVGHAQDACGKLYGDECAAAEAAFDDLEDELKIGALTCAIPRQIRR